MKASNQFESQEEPEFLPQSLPWILGSALLGATVMFLMDPQQGRRRRALLRDQMIHFQVKSSKIFGSTYRDLRNRTQGVLHRNLDRQTLH